MRILVVDDDADTAALQAQLLAANGYDAHVCVHGDQALETIRRLRPEVVMLDLAMPVMSGLDIAEELRKHPDIRPKLLIAVTGYGDFSKREEIKAADFDLYLLKPVPFWRLKAALDAVEK